MYGGSDDARADTKAQSDARKRNGALMNEQLSAEQKARLARLEAVPGEKIMVVGIKRYLSIVTVSAILGKSRSAVSKWCDNGAVFSGVKRSPVHYKSCYLVPLEEVERVILEDALPRPGNPRFETNATNPYPPRQASPHYRRISKECELFLSSLSNGEGGEVLLEEGDRKGSVRRYLEQAAARMGAAIRFFRTAQDRIVFTIETSQ